MEWVGDFVPQPYERVKGANASRRDGLWPPLTRSSGYGSWQKWAQLASACWPAKAAGGGQLKLWGMMETAVQIQRVLRNPNKSDVGGDYKKLQYNQKFPHVPDSVFCSADDGLARL